MIICIDNGHGKDTAGKRSPDGRLREYAYCREIAKRVQETLKADGIDARLIVPEDWDVSLSERCRRVNKICEEAKDAQKVALVSIHNNAAGNGGWMNARGWSGWVYRNAGWRAKQLAQLLYAEAERFSLQGNRSVPACKYWEAGFYILRNTRCPAVLTENLFQDNKEDVGFLLSDYGKQTIVDLHCNGIRNYIAQQCD